LRTKTLSQGQSEGTGGTSGGGVRITMHECVNVAPRTYVSSEPRSVRPLWPF
jgi:hypothetical protein